MTNARRLTQNRSKICFRKLRRSLELRILLLPCFDTELQVLQERCKVVSFLRRKSCTIRSIEMSMQRTALCCYELNSWQQKPTVNRTASYSAHSYVVVIDWRNDCCLVSSYYAAHLDLEIDDALFLELHPLCIMSGLSEVLLHWCQCSVSANRK